jgi:preprotein translocase subunit SecE
VACINLLEYIAMKAITGIIDFLATVRVELTKVVWPTPQQTLKLTVIVILVTVIVGFFVGGIDLALTKLFEIVLNR